MKKKLLVVAILVAAAFASHAQGRFSMDVILGRRPPNANERRAMFAEEQAHPNIASAMHSIESAMAALNNAPSDFNGHKAEAQAKLQQAYWALRKALYFKLYEGQ